MKKLRLAALFICGAFMMMSFTNVSAPTSVTNFSVKSVQWKSTSVEVGNIPQGKPYAVEFEFTNTGKEAVIVTNAQAGCGCTIADYPKEPIAPGKTAKIKATYNAAAIGVFNKNVTVYIQNEEPVTLYLKGTVI